MSTLLRCAHAKHAAQRIHLGQTNYAKPKVRSHCDGSGNGFVAYLFIRSRFLTATAKKVAYMCIWHCFFPLLLPSQNGSTTHLHMIPLLLPLPSVTIWTVSYVCIEPIQNDKDPIAIAITMWTSLKIFFFTTQQWSCRKVMFLYLCVILFTGEGAVWCHFLSSCLVQCSFCGAPFGGGGLPPGEVSLHGGFLPEGGLPPGGIALRPCYWHLMAATKAGSTHPTGMHSC